MRYLYRENIGAPIPAFPTKNQSVIAGGVCAILR